MVWHNSNLFKLRRSVLLQSFQANHIKTNVKLVKQRISGYVCEYLEIQMKKASK